MIRSMTGYGEASLQSDGGHYFLEVRSLNNKYFKTLIRLPEEFQGLEAEIEQKLRERLSRGTITVNARCAEVSESAAHAVNVKALEKYIEQISALPQIRSGTLTLDLAALLPLPGVLQPPTNEEARLDRARKAFLTLLDRACASLIKMREIEGQSLIKELDSHRAYIEERVHLIRDLAPGVVAEYESRLRSRIQLLLQEAGVSVQQVDLIREIAAYAERTDIAEETQRLQAHLNQFAEYLRSKDERPIGRTLDFLAQEMLRETNTIASKSPDSTISRHAVEIKGAIDRIKEQAQNVE